MRTLAETRELREYKKQKIKDDEDMEKELIEAGKIFGKCRPDSESEDELDVDEPEDHLEDRLSLVEKSITFSEIYNCIENLFKYNIEPRNGIRLKEIKRLEDDDDNTSIHYQIKHNDRIIGEISLSLKWRFNWRLR